MRSRLFSQQKGPVANLSFAVTQFLIYYFVHSLIFFSQTLRHLVSLVKCCSAFQPGALPYPQYFPLRVDELGVSLSPLFITCTPPAQGLLSPLLFSPCHTTDGRYNSLQHPELDLCTTNRSGLLPEAHIAFCTERAMNIVCCPQALQIPPLLQYISLLLYTSKSL